MTCVKRLHFSWGCTHVINHAAQFGLVDSIKADTVLHVGLAQLEAENTRLREALEEAKECFEELAFLSASDQSSVNKGVKAIKEALKQ